MTKSDTDATWRAAVDCMGGDAGPEMVLDGVKRAVQEFPNGRFLLHGTEKAKELFDTFPTLAHCCEFHLSPHVVEDDQKPRDALRIWETTSMGMAVAAVRDGVADFAISSGNTGALMGIALFGLGRLPGIDRPAIAAVFPTQRGQAVFLDLGANVLADARNLVQFAVLGDLFARDVMNIKLPSVGLLNIGSEPQKGKEELRDAAEQLSRFPDLNFMGFVEAFDLTQGQVDVVVTDGFTGNICLKMAEGASKQFTFFLRHFVRQSWTAKLGFLLAKGALQKFRYQLDPRRYNGAAFLGLRGLCIKSHGGADGFGFANAVGVGADLVVRGYIKQAEARLAEIPEAQLKGFSISKAASKAST